MYRAGYSEEDLKLGRLRHIFDHVGAQLVEVVELEDERGYPDQHNPDSRNTNPHWAFGATPEDIARFAEHLTREGIPHNGPRGHFGTSVLSLYFRDCEGNNLEVTTWKESDPKAMRAAAVGGDQGFIPWPKLAHKWRPKSRKT